MSCKNLVEWLENSEYASLNNMPVELENHILTCQSCSRLIVTLTKHASIPTHSSLQKQKSNIKQNLFPQSKPIQPSNLETIIEFLKLFYKPAFALLLGLFAISFTLPTKSTTSKVSQILPAAKVTALLNKASFCDHTTGIEKPLSVEEKVYTSDVLTTESDAEVELFYTNKNLIALGPNSQFVIGDGHNVGKLLEGRAIFNIEKATDKNKPTTLYMPFATLSVLGTKFVVNVEQEQIFVAVSEGVVEIEAFDNKCLLQASDLLTIDKTNASLSAQKLENEDISILMNLKSQLPLTSVLTPSTESQNIEDTKAKHIRVKSPEETEEKNNLENSDSRVHEQDNEIFYEYEEDSDESLDEATSLKEPPTSNSRTLGISGY